MKLIKKTKKGYTLLELVIALGVSVTIVFIGLIATNKWFKQVEAKKTAVEIQQILNNAKALSLVNAPDGSTQSSNLITMDILRDQGALPDVYARAKNTGYFIPDLGQMSVGYAAEYPKSNVLEVRLRNVEPETCIGLISNIAPKTFEMKIGNSYLAYNQINLNGNVSYVANVSKSISLCQGLKPDTVIRIRDYSEPDFTKIYTLGGDIAGTNDPKAPERNAQIKKYTDSYDYTYAERLKHIKSNLVK